MCVQDGCLMSPILKPKSPTKPRKFLLKRQIRSTIELVLRLKKKNFGIKKIKMLRKGKIDQSGKHV